MKKIVLGVTQARSLGLMRGLPERLTEEGWEVHMVSDGARQHGSFKGSGVTLHNIAMKREPSIIADLRALCSWVSLLRKLEPDAIMVGTPKAGLLGILSSWVTGVPTRIYHLRGLRLESSSGIARTSYWILEKITFLLSSHSLAVSASLKQRVIELGLVHARKVKTLGLGSSNGIDLERFYSDHEHNVHRSALGIDEDVPVVGFVGRVTYDKGVEELAAASHLLHQNGVAHQLLIVGPAESASLVEKLRHTSSGRGPVFTGKVSDVVPYYHLMDLLCLPSHREGFPNVVLEAGATGLPTVTTNATGAIDSVLDGITGYIVPAKNHKELARKLAELLQDPSKRKELGQAAREHVTENYKRQVVQDKIAAFLAGTLAIRS